MSAISYYDKFVGVDWNRYAQIASKATCFCSCVTAIVSLIFGFSTAISLLALLCENNY